MLTMRGTGLTGQGKNNVTEQTTAKSQAKPSSAVVRHQQETVIKIKEKERGKLFVEAIG